MYVAVRIGEKEAPYGIFSLLFRLEFAPFSWIFTYLLRFLLYLLIAAIGFFVSVPWAFVGAAVFLYAKYFGEIIVLCFLTDAIASAVLSLLLAYLPILLLGVFLYFMLFLKANELKMCGGNPFNGKTLSKTLLFLLRLVLLYFVFCIFIFLAVCGLFYLVIIAV